MAITFVAAEGNNFSGSASPNTTIPAGTQDGDLLLMFFNTDSAHNSTGTPPTGVTLVGEQDNGTDNTLSVFRKVAASEGGVIAFTNIFDTTETGRVLCLAYRGVDQSTPMDAAAAFGTDSGTAWDAGPIVTVTDNAMVVACFAADPASDPYTFTWDGGITERIDSDTTPTGQNGQLAYIAIGDKIVTPAGSTTLGGDVSVSDSAAAAILALRPATAAASLIANPAPLAHLRAR